MKFTYTSRLHSATTVDFDNSTCGTGINHCTNRLARMQCVVCSHEVRSLPLRVLETPLFPLGRLCKSGLNLNKL